MRQLLANIEEFISAVQSRPALYNMNLDEFNNKELTQILWEEIASEFDTNVDYCKNKWAILRVSFSRQIRNEEKTRSGVAFIHDWYLKDNMSFMREFMRQRRKRKSSECDIDNNDSLYKSNSEVQEDKKFSQSLLEIDIKSEPDDESVASLDIYSYEDILEDSKKISDPVTNNESLPIDNQNKQAGNTNPGSNSRKKKKSTEQDQFLTFAKKTEHEPPLKKNTSQVEYPLQQTSRSNKNEQDKLSLMQRSNEDAVMTFFKSIVPDVIKLTGRRQRLLKQRLMENLNTLLDEQEED